MSRAGSEKTVSKTKLSPLLSNSRRSASATRAASYDRRPIIVAIAGPNGAGKTTFYHAHLAAAGLRFVNADVLAAELALAP